VCAAGAVVVSWPWQSKVDGVLVEVRQLGADVVAKPVCAARGGQ